MSAAKRLIEIVNEARDFVHADPRVESKNDNPLFPTLVCEDGYSLSVQASSGHFCIPRADGLDAYSHVEVANPSEFSDHLAPYGDEESCFYPDVPVETVMQILNLHGGVSLQRTLAYKLRFQPAEPKKALMQA